MNQSELTKWPEPNLKFSNMDTLLATQVISISKANAFVLDVVQDFAIAHLTESNFSFTSYFLL